MKFRATCRSMDAVVVGNGVLAAEAKLAGRPVVILPTALDPSRYRPMSVDPGRAPTVVWVGSPENLVYLELVRPALRRLTAIYPTLVLKVVCSHFPDWQDVRIERVPWSHEAEVAALESADIGVMPLTDDAWARGKCAFKLLQYMAASLPTVASAVGANTEAVIDGTTGYLARDDAEWEAALGRLIASPESRLQLGNAGRAHLEAHYAVAGYAAAYVELMEDVAQYRI
jgi:glycosyltransferase involved in cell wall biosynthesis